MCPKALQKLVSARHTRRPTQDTRRTTATTTNIHTYIHTSTSPHAHDLCAHTARHTPGRPRRCRSHRVGAVHSTRSLPNSTTARRCPTAPARFREPTSHPGGGGGCAAQQTQHRVVSGPVMTSRRQCISHKTMRAARRSQRASVSSRHGALVFAARVLRDANPERPSARRATERTCGGTRSDIESESPRPRADAPQGNWPQEAIGSDIGQRALALASRRVGRQDPEPCGARSPRSAQSARGSGSAQSARSSSSTAPARRGGSAGAQRPPDYHPGERLADERRARRRRRRRACRGGDGRRREWWRRRLLARNKLADLSELALRAFELGPGSRDARSRRIQGRRHAGLAATK